MITGLLLLIGFIILFIKIEEKDLVLPLFLVMLIVFLFVTAIIPNDYKIEQNIYKINLEQNDKYIYYQNHYETSFLLQTNNEEKIITTPKKYVKLYTKENEAFIIERKKILTESIINKFAIEYTFNPTKYQIYLPAKTMLINTFTVEQMIKINKGNL